MATEHDYKCTRCGKDTRRHMLTVKKVLFTEMGQGARTERARVVAWLCPPCVKIDPDWNRPAGVTPEYESEIIKLV